MASTNPASRLNRRELKDRLGLASSDRTPPAQLRTMYTERFGEGSLRQPRPNLGRNATRDQRRRKRTGLSRYTAGPGGWSSKFLRNRGVGAGAAKTLGKVLGMAIPGAGAAMTLWTVADLIGMLSGGDTPEDYANKAGLSNVVGNTLFDPEMIQAGQDRDLMQLGAALGETGRSEAGEDELMAILQENAPIIQQLSTPMLPQQSRTPVPSMMPGLYG